MKTRIFLGMLALAAFTALPVYAQHGHGGTSGSSLSHDHSSSSHGKSDADHDSGHDATHSGHKTISQKLAANPKLASKLQGLLPPGTDLTAASQGFKNLGQFVAAVHVSHNLGIPFDQLKAKMTGPPPESLGKAIHDLKPAANAKAETKKAEKQAHQDLDTDSKAS